MKKFRTSFTAIASVCILSLSAQETPSVSSAASPDTTKSKCIWSIGLSGVAIDDDGNPTTDLFNASESWHFVPYPSRLHVDAAFNKNWSVEGALSLSQYQSGKVVNDMVINEDNQFLAFDVNAKYHFAGDAKVFDPYGLAGLGFTYRSVLQEQTPTLNAGLGANIWFIPSFGLNLQTSVKFKLNSKSSSYMMHSLGLVYRFGK
jgi:OOP family OmpA-OmpF porin